MDLPDPPDGQRSIPARMEYSPHGTSLRVDFVNTSDPPSSPAAKKQKPGNNPPGENSASVDLVDDSSSILNKVDLNVLPTVNSAGVCSVCSAEIDPNHTLTCCSCSRRFHPECPDLSNLSNRGIKVAPKPTYVGHFNHIMKSSYLSGCFSWECNSCVSIKKLSENKFLGDRLALLEAAFIQQKPVMPLVEKIARKIEELPNAAAASISHQMNNPPPRRGSFSDQTTLKRSHSGAAAGFSNQLYSAVTAGPVPRAISNPALNNGPQQQACSPTYPTGVRPSGPKSPPKRFRITLTNPKESDPIRMVLSKYVAQKIMSDCDYKVYGRNSVDLLFHTMAEAKAEHSKLVESLKDITISEPDMNLSRKAYFVGLADYHTKEGLHDYLYSKYGDALLLHGTNANCLKVLSIDPCLNDPTVYRATLQLSQDVLDIISGSFNNRLRYGFSTCIIYPINPHKRCRKCQVHGHNKGQCQKAKPTCSYCAGDHFSDQCPHAGNEEKRKCINCFNSVKYKDQCHSHSADSNECPIFRDFRRIQKSKD